MPTLNMKDFLASGAFLQTGPDQYTLFKGPFKAQTQPLPRALKASNCLINPDFWFFLNSPENNAQEFVYQPDFVEELNREEFIGMLSSWASERPHISWASPDEGAFREQFDWSLRLFNENQLEKTVPIIEQTGLGPSFSEPHKVFLLSRVLELQDYGWSYGFWDGNRGFIGHTPEILLQYDAGSQRAQTMALAGTYPLSADVENLIKADHKICREHEIVIEDLRKKLLHRDLQIEPTNVLRLKYMAHLKTDIHYSLQSIEDVLADLRLLHPTAAMGLHPSSKERYEDMLRFKIQKGRGHFAAPFGLLTAEKAHVIVGIRQMQFASEKVRILSGCGVTSDSQYDVELKELENKRNSVKKMLGLQHD